MKILFGILFILLGLFFISYRNKIGQFAINQWHETFPNIKIWEKGYSIAFLICGVVFVVFGLLSVFNIINLK
jgi:hypothetical protein